MDAIYPHFIAATVLKLWLIKRSQLEIDEKTAFVLSTKCFYSFSYGK